MKSASGSPVSKRPQDLGPMDAPDPVGGLLAMEAADELALGSPDDYGGDDDMLALGAVDDYSEEILTLGEADGDEPVFGLSFSAAPREPTAEWDLADLQELVVQETQGDFDRDGSARHDVRVMEEEFDPDDDVVMAVWEGPEGYKVGTRVRRHAAIPQQYVPYGLIAAGLGALLLLSLGTIVLLVIVAMVSGPNVEVQPLDPAKIPQVEIERRPIEEQTADEILEEVLGDDADEGEK